MLNSLSVIKELKSKGTLERAKASAWFFKTKKGQYGYGDVFYGLTVPEMRIAAKKYKDLPLEEIEKLLKNKVHECRLVALLILVERFKKADKKEQKKIFDFYISHTGGINNWDLVDLSAPKIVGGYLSDKNKERKILYKLVRSKNMWERRIAVLATFAFITRGEFEDALKINEILISDNHDLIHKATGWMLREMGKKNIDILKKYLEKNMRQMPRTALRYAIERFPEKERKEILESSKVKVKEKN